MYQLNPWFNGKDFAVNREYQKRSNKFFYCSGAWESVGHVVQMEIVQRFGRSLYCSTKMSLESHLETGSLKHVESRHGGTKTDME